VRRLDVILRLVIALLFFWGRPVVCSPSELYLEDAIDLAFSNNPSLQELSVRIDEAEGYIMQARASYFPNVRFNAVVAGGDAPSFYLFHTIDAGRLAPMTDFNDPGALTNFGYGLSLEQELFSWGRRGDKVAAACARREVAEHRWSDYANQLVGMIIAVYLDILKASAARETAERSIMLVRKQLDVAEKKLEKEVILKTDVLKLEVRLAEVKERSICALSAERQAKEILVSLLGKEDCQEFMIAEQTEFLALESDSEQWEAALKNPNMYGVWAAEAEVKMACREVEVARTYSLPTLDFFARTYVDSPDHPFRNKRTNWLAGCTLTWDLYTGGRVSAKKSMARAVLGQVEQRLRGERQRVREQIAIAQQRRKEAQERLRTAEIGELSAKESFLLLESQYEQGVASITSYLEAEEMLASASLRVRMAFYDLYKAEAEVLRAIGFLSTRYK